MAVGVLWLALLASPAQAEQAVGIVEGSNLLVTFDTAVPGALTSTKQLTGLQPGERALGLDFRHLPFGVETPPQLFALGVTDVGGTDDVRLYTIDAGTGAATPLSVAAIAGVADGNAYGMDFSPGSDRVRVVNDADGNLRINPNNGVVAGMDTPLNPAGQDISAVAFDRANVPQPTPTTAFGISRTNSTLVTIGGIDGTPSGNLGGVMNAKALGVGIAPGSEGNLNFDIAFGGTAFATLTATGGESGLYTVDLATGAATLIGALAAPLGAFTTVPASSVQFDAAGVSQAESGPANAAVTRSGSLAATTTVAYTTSAGTASSDDFAAISGTLTFAPGETAKTIEITLASDATDEPDETLTLALSGPSPPMALGAQPATTITIVDDDEPVLPAPPPDTTPPAVTLKLRSSMSLSKFRKGFKITLTPDEAASFKAELRGTVKKAQVSAFNLRLASKSLKLGTGARKLILKPKRRLVGRPRKRFKVRLMVTATDASGNLTEIARKITVKPRG